MSFFEELKRRNVFRVGIAYGVATWLLIQVSDTVFPRIGLPDSAVTLVIALLAIGFIPALIFAWAFEMTPEGIKREADVDRAESITPQTSKKLDRVIITVMALVIAFLVLDRFLLQERSADEKTTATLAAENAPVDSTTAAEEEYPSVAVLPFINMSGNTDNEYFSDGLTETLLHMLAQLPELRVAARTSSFAFKGQNTSVPDIATALGVDNILEGSVQRVGDRVRVTAQLIRAEDGFHVWSQNYDRTLEDIFAIQDEIANDVVNALDASLLGGDRHLTNIATDNLDAYDLYLKALEQQAIYTYASMAEAESLLKQALAQDPGFVDAKLALSRNYLMMEGTGLLSGGQVKERITPLLEQVTADQPENALARALTMLLEQRDADLSADSDFARQAEELRSMLALVPTESYVRSIVASTISGFFNRPKEALEIIDAGLLLDPLSGYLNVRRGMILRQLEKLEESERALLRAIELEPGYASAYYRLADTVAEQGDLVGKLRWLRKAVEADTQDHELAAALAIELFQLGLAEEGDRWAQRVYALAPASAVARATAVWQAWGHGDWAKGEQLSQSMLRDKVRNRQGAFSDALMIYHLLMARQNRDREAFEFLGTIKEGILDFDTAPTDWRGKDTQWTAILMMAMFAGPAETLAAWEKWVAHLERTGAGWQEDGEGFLLTDALIRGDRDTAIRMALRELRSPLADEVFLNELYRMPLLDPVTSDPAVAARMAERDRELEQAKREVLTMLERPEWQ